MCRLPMMRAPASGFAAPCWRRKAIRPGISCSARRISLRPYSASDRSLTLYGSRPAAFAASNAWSFSTAIVMHFSFTRLATKARKHEEELHPFRVFVSSWLHLFLSCRDEQSRSLRTRVWRQRNDTDALESCVIQHPGDVILRESEPDVAHLLTVALSIVGQHVGDDQAATRLQHARHLGQRERRVGQMVQHQHQRRGI